MEEQLIAIAEKSPVVAIAGYLIWRMTSQGTTFATSINQVSELVRQVVPVIREMNEGIRQTAAAIREIRVQAEADRRMMEELQRQTAAQLQELRAELKGLKQ